MDELFRIWFWNLSSQFEEKIVQYFIQIRSLVYQVISLSSWLQRTEIKKTLIYKHWRETERAPEFYQLCETEKIQFTGWTPNTDRLYVRDPRLETVRQTWCKSRAPTWWTWGATRPRPSGVRDTPPGLPIAPPRVTMGRGHRLRPTPPTPRWQRNWWQSYRLGFTLLIPPREIYESEIFFFQFCINWWFVFKETDIISVKISKS